MGEVINKVGLKKALEGTKDYVDSQATAQVIRSATTLYTASGTTTPDTITLSQSLDDFDAVEVLTAGTTNLIMPYTLDMSDVVYGTTQVGFQLDSSYYVWYTFTNATTMTKNYGEHEGYIKAVKGIKYTVPEAYSTNEQIIGTWIDGKPLYQKTIQMPSVSPTNRQVSVALGAAIDTLVDITGTFQTTSGVKGALPAVMAGSDSGDYAVNSQTVIYVNANNTVFVKTGYKNNDTFSKVFVTLKYTKGS